MPGKKAGGYEMPFTGTGKPYLKAVEGKLRHTVEEGTPKAKKRNWEVNGKSGVLWELVYDNWSGVIHDIEIQTSHFGDTCFVELWDAIIVLKTNSKYFSSFAKRVKNGDLKETFTFHPYDFEVDGKQKIGISLQQGGNKLKDYYYNGEENVNGIPVPDQDKADKKGYWKMYFGEVEEFLISELKGMKFEKPEVKEVAYEELGKEIGQTEIAKEVESLKESSEPKGPGLDEIFKS